MLKDTLYRITHTHLAENSLEVSVVLDGDNAIFKGHFPGNPVLPGACMLQMVKELLETALCMPLQLVKADEMKFLAIIQPGEDELLFSIQYHTSADAVIKTNAKITRSGVVCFKMRGSFR